MKKLFLSLLVLSLFFSTVLLSQAQDLQVSDQSEFDQVKTENLLKIEKLYAQFLQIEKEEVLPLDFVDISGYRYEGTDLVKAVEYWVYQVPLLKGEGDTGRFGIYEGMPRAVISEVLLRLSRLIEGFEYEDADSEVLLNDVAKGVWYEESIKSAVANGIFIPKEGNVRPDELVNWAELVTILRRFLGLDLIIPEIRYADSAVRLEWHDPEFFTLRTSGILKNSRSTPAEAPDKGDFAVLLYYAFGQSFRVEADDFGSSTVNCPFYQKSDEEIEWGENASSGYWTPGDMDLCYLREENNVACLELEGDERDECWNVLAFQSRQLHYCSQISDENEFWRNLCFRPLFSHFDECTWFEDIEDRRWCYQDFRNSMNNSSYCNVEKNLEVRDRCHLFYSFLSYESDDLEVPFCLAIQDQLLKDECFGRVGEGKDEAKFCERVIDSGIKANCYKNIAHDKQDDSFCNLIPTGDIKDACFMAVAGSSNNEELCKKIENPSIKDDCYISNTVLYERSDLCAFIEETSKRDHCYREMAFRSFNLKLCESVDDLSSKQDCLRDIGKMKSVKEECGSLEYGKDEECYLEYAKEAEDPAYCYLMGYGSDWGECFEFMDNLSDDDY
jgi:hypothetical protein